MKKIETIISVARLDEVKDALSRRGIEGMTVSDVRRFDGHASVAMYRGATYTIDFQSRVKVEVAIADDQVPAAVEVLEQILFEDTGGDGSVFVIPITEVVRVRTGEHHQAALRGKGRVAARQPYPAVVHQ
jgi:nitrogen regulatory protein P-II 1